VLLREKDRLAACAGLAPRVVAAFAGCKAVAEAELVSITFDLTFLDFVFTVIGRRARFVFNPLECDLRVGVFLVFSDIRGVFPTFAEVRGVFPTFADVRGGVVAPLLSDVRGVFSELDDALGRL